MNQTGSVDAGDFDVVGGKSGDDDDGENDDVRKMQMGL